MARNALLDAARLLEEASARLYKGLEELGGTGAPSRTKGSSLCSFLAVGGYTTAARYSRAVAKGLTTILGTTARVRNMIRPLWQLLLEDRSDLTCDECFALMGYYAELLARGGVGLLPVVIEHLKECPDCETQYREELRSLSGSQSEASAASLPNLAESDGSETEE